MTGRQHNSADPVDTFGLTPKRLRWHRLRGVRRLFHRRVENGRFYAAVIEMLGEGVIVQDAGGRIQTANPEAARILGLTVEQMIGRVSADPRWGIVDEHDNPPPGDTLPAAVAMRTGEPVLDFTMGVRRPDGDLRWLNLNAFPLKNEPDTAPYPVVISVRDVTEERAATRKMHFQASLLDAAGQAIIATDVLGRVTYWNPAAEQMYGWSAPEALGRNILEVTPSAAMAERAGEIFAKLAAGESWAGDFVVRRRDGTSFPAFVTDTPVFDEQGQLTSVIGVSTDISERKLAEEAMSTLSAIVESSGDAIIGKSLDGTVISWNRGAQDLYGYRADEVLGHHVRMLAPDASQDDLVDVLRHVALGETVERLETTRRHKDGRVIDVSLTVSPVRGQDGSVVGSSAIARDITARAEAQRALRRHALHDTLTDLPNRVLLADRLSQALARARRHHERVAVMFLDLDGFKLVNDGLGHLAGDELLVQVARRLAGCVRSDDTLARFGGDEFVIVCEVSATDVATEYGNRLLTALQPPFRLRGKDLLVTASIGLVVADADSEPEQLLQAADVAMYRAKERGRSRMELFDDELRDRAELALQSSTALRQALEHGQLRVFYQPIVDVGDSRPVAIEALLRWQHPDRGLVSPDEFISLAEESGMIVPIGRWVLREALRERALWESTQPGQAPLRLAVNLSARQLSEPGLVDDIAAALRAHDTDPGLLILEITESVLMQDPTSLATLKAIHDLGIAIHVDDFGTGYSSLAYLKTLPVDALKIDRAFLHGLGTDTDDQAIVTAVLALARALRLDVVAEGVETPQQLRALKDLGCDFAQGYLFSRPLPYDELLSWFESRGQPPRRQEHLPRLPQSGKRDKGPASATVSLTSAPKSLDTIRALCHDLRQPLAVIRLLAGVEHGDVQPQLTGILEQAQWLSDMVENVIGGAVDDTATRIDVVELASRAVSRARPTAAGCEIEVTGVDHAVAVVTPVALGRAIGCVLDNAVRAAGPDGHVAVAVNDRLAHTGNPTHPGNLAHPDAEITIEVTDDGPGLGKVPANNSLGLTITRALVGACGGAFDLTPGPAGGVVARIVLPAIPLAIAS